MASKDEATAILIEVDVIKERTSKTGKNYWSIKSGETWYNTFDESVKDRLKEGVAASVMVTSTTSQGKEFHNIVGIAPSDFEDISAELDSLGLSAPPPPTKQAYIKPPAQTPSTPTTPSMFDVRKTALDGMTRLLAAGKITEKNVNKTLAEYEQYLLHGLNTEQKISSENGPVLDLEEFVANG